MKKMSYLLIVICLLMVFPLNIFALSATTRLDYKGPRSGTYTIIITLQKASDVSGFTSTIVVPDTVTINDDITCGSGSTCTITNGAISVSNSAGLSDEICRFTVSTTDSYLDLSLSSSKISNESGSTVNVYNPSTTANGSSENPSTGLVSTITLFSILVASLLIVNNISKKNKFKNI